MQYRKNHSLEGGRAEGSWISKVKEKEREKKKDDMCPNMIWTHNIAGSIFNVTRISDLFCSLSPPHSLQFWISSWEGTPSWGRCLMIPLLPEGRLHCTPLPWDHAEAALLITSWLHRHIYLPNISTISQYFRFPEDHLSLVNNIPEINHITQHWFQ